ncbi:pimeloyl-ACP methyl ester carboxylesterase [Saccharopolyspora lacisalsi]|uniref:Pimeloyl-ACP methyl ester carboxylesterase n=1 Tax=Halosaccharopolyspora lacisalsi TaxID=1000566 RepID=A0A839E2K0_9PSEU|nr:pimeloyl-ACP methyl ester carboxylesterase [Halosaccharopolyspora lacisalsi]
MLWLHGYTMDSSLWQPLWELLPDWRHVGVDLPGHGATSRPLSAEGGFAGLASELADVLRSRNISRVVALSFGTTAALQLAIDHPDLVSRLVLAAPTVAGGAGAPRVAERYRDLRRLFATFGPGRHMTDLWMQSPPDIFRGTESRPLVRERIRTVVDRHRWTELANGAMRQLNQHLQSTAALAGIPASVLCVVGEQDMPAFGDNAGTLRRTVPDCRVTTVPGTGHLPLLESPEVVAPEIGAHL